MTVEVIDTYKLGTRTVYCIRNDKTRTREETSKYWLGKEVNGFIVKGVETYAKPIINEGESIGLLVDTKWR